MLTYYTMKTLRQIKRYTSQNQFPEDDWQQVLTYCRKIFGGGHIHVAVRPIGQSTYEEFLAWLDYGFSEGDMVGYGNTMGILGGAYGSRIFMLAYLDFDGNLIKKEMDVLEPQRLRHLSESEKEKFNLKLYREGLCYSAISNSLRELYIPEKNSYVIIGDDSMKDPDVGFFSSSDGCKYKFAALLKDGVVFLDCEINADCTPLFRATATDIKRFIKAVAAAGYVFNARAQEFKKQPHRGRQNKYYYINDRFEVERDIDNGTQRHDVRFKAKNYFFDEGEAIMFVKDIKKLRELGPA